MRQRILAITMGDPAGIGPEIVVNALQTKYDDVHVVVYGDAHRLRLAAARVGAPWHVNVIDDIADAKPLAGSVDVIQIGQISSDMPFGHVSAAAGAASFAYVEKAIEAARFGHCDGIVTAPINKSAWTAAGIDVPGHTELLAERCNVDDVAMMLFNPELRVVLVSIHVPLSEAVRLVTYDRELRTIRLAHAAAMRLGIASPRVAVAGLNPHAGENGKFGREDDAIIAPAIAGARAEGINASGPWPGDTVFMRARSGEFDIVVAQYHDQGLIPIKYLGVDTGVNVTLGLPFVRTSVDHGTAFDIAGTGRADAGSLATAIRHAAKMMQSR